MQPGGRFNHAPPPFVMPNQLLRAQLPGGVAVPPAGHPSVPVSQHQHHHHHHHQHQHQHHHHHQHQQQHNSQEANAAAGALLRARAGKARVQQAGPSGPLPAATPTATATATAPQHVAARGAGDAVPLAQQLEGANTELRQLEQQLAAAKAECEDLQRRVAQHNAEAAQEQARAGVAKASAATLEGDAKQVREEEAKLREALEQKKADAAQALYDIGCEAEALRASAAERARRGLDCVPPTEAQPSGADALKDVFESLVSAAMASKQPPLEVPAEGMAQDALPQGFAADVAAVRQHLYPANHSSFGAEEFDTFFGRVLADERSTPLCIPRLQEVRCLWKTWPQLKVGRGRPDVNCIVEPSVNRKVELLRQVAGGATETSKDTVSRLLMLVASDDDSLHPLERVSVLVAQYRDKDTSMLYGYGGRVEAKDGDDEAEAVPRAAKRVMREISGVDLKDVEVRPIFEVDVAEDEGNLCHCFYAADFTASGPHVFDVRKGEKASAELSVTPCLVTLHDLLSSRAEECDATLRLAAEALRLLMVTHVSHDLLQQLKEAAGNGGRFPSRKKRRRDPVPPGAEALVVTEALSRVCEAPLKFIDALADRGSLQVTGRVTRSHVAKHLLCANPNLADTQLYRLLSPLGLHVGTECRYHAHLVQRDVNHVCPGKPAAASAAAPEAAAPVAVLPAGPVSITPVPPPSVTQAPRQQRGQARAKGPHTVPMSPNQQGPPNKRQRTATAGGKGVPMAVPPPPPPPPPS